VSAAILVIDIGGTHLKFGAVVAGQSKILGRHFPTQLLHGNDPVGALVAMIAEAVAALGVTPGKIVSTVPGFLDPDHDLVHYAGNIQNLNNRRLASELAARTGIPVVLERDSVMSLMGEWTSGAAQGSQNLLGLFFGTGVGGAFLQNGKPFRGAGYALEIGNMPFKGEGRSLPGRRTDCLETYVSGAALQAIAARNKISVPDVFVSPDSAVKDEVAGFLRDFAIAVGIAIALFSPDCVLLGGGICEMVGFPKLQVAESIASNAPYDEMGMKMDLRWASLGWESVLVGAHMVASQGII